MTSPRACVQQLAASLSRVLRQAQSEIGTSSFGMNDPTSIRNTQRLAPDAQGIARAADLLRSGGLVAFPTETVYGLGADATDARAVAGIYAAKERPSFNPLIAHLPDVETALAQGRFGPLAQRLARAFWPGPLTLVVDKSDACRVADLATAGLDSV